MKSRAQVSNAQAVDRTGSGGDTDPGTLTYYNDDTCQFAGNGETTPATVMSNIIQYYAKKDAELQPFVGNRDAASLAALNALDTQNQHLKGLSADDPIPTGELFHANGGNSLKALLAPFVENLDKLKGAVQALENRSLSERDNRYIGRVAPGGLTLPVE